MSKRSHPSEMYAIDPGINGSNVVPYSCKPIRLLSIAPVLSWTAPWVLSVVSMPSNGSAVPEPRSGLVQRITREGFPPNPMPSG